MSSNKRLVVLFFALLTLAFASIAAADCVERDIWIEDNAAQWIWTSYGYEYIEATGHWETIVECYRECEEEYFWVVDEPARWVWVDRGIYEYIEEQGHWEMRLVCR